MIKFKDTKRMQRWGTAGEIGIIVKEHGKIYDIRMCKSSVLQTYISERDVEVMK